MARRKRATATVKMTYDEDADLIAWWNGLPHGTRNAVMKDVMRDYIARNGGGYRPIYPRNQPQPFQPQQFLQLVDDAAWLRAAMGDLPAYVERLMQSVSVQPTAILPRSTAGIDEAVVNKRESRMRKAQW